MLRATEYPWCMLFAVLHGAHWKLHAVCCALHAVLMKSCSDRSAIPSQYCGDIMRQKQLLQRCGQPDALTQRLRTKRYSHFQSQSLPIPSRRPRSNVLCTRVLLPRAVRHHRQYCRPSAVGTVQHYGVSASATHGVAPVVSTTSAARAARA